MNKDKAIQLLERLQNPEPYDPVLTKDAYDAIQMAIDALSADGDTISREAAIDALDEIEAEVADGYGYQYAKWREYFVKMPPAQPKRGKWKNIVDGIEYSWGTCDTCGARIPMAYKYYEYCPNCGAKMEVTT